MYNILERNKTNENHENKNLDNHSYILIKNKNYISSIKDDDNKIIIGSKNGIKDESNNNFYESNVIFNMTENVLNHAPSNEEKKSQKLSESIPAEELFIKQKDKIKHYKDMLEKEKQNVYKNENSLNNDTFEQKEIVNENKKNISLEDFYLFEITSFIHNRDSKFKENRIPVFKANNWKRLNEPKFNFDLKNIALRTINDIDYDKKMVKININFTLKEESELWIFTRCFMKSDTINININNTSFNNDIDKIFNKYSSVIKIIKKRDSNKSFITFGTFCENMKNSNKVSYKSFLKRHCDFNLYIIDKGDDCIDAKVSINSDNKFNQVIAKFYLPTNNKSKLLFCGEGDCIIIKDLNINYLDKNEQLEEEFETLFSFEQKSCNCCFVI